jgi:adenylate cyclase
MRNRSINFYIVSLASMFLCLFIQFFDPVFVREYMESKTYDLRLYLKNVLREQQVDNSIVIVAVDEKSLSEVGRWPWSRTVMADLVEKIGECRPKAIGIDIMFSEKETSEGDARLAEAISRAGNVVLATAFLLPSDESEEKAPPAVPDYLWDSAFMTVKTVPDIDWKQWATKAVKVIPPVEVIARAASLGQVTAKTDMDGVLRSEILSLNYGDDCYPSFALQVARIALGVAAKDMVLYGGSSIRLTDRIIPTDLYGHNLINYLGAENSFRYISATDLLHGKIARSALMGKIVLVGTSALATYDQKVTPLSRNMPGVEKNANVVQNILTNNFIMKSPGVIELLVILATSLILIVLLPRLNATRGVILGFGLITAYFSLSILLLIYSLIWINLFFPVANMLVIVTMQTTTKLFAEEKRAQDIREMFSSYVSPKIVEMLINNPEKAGMGGERRTVTILFSDIIGFTTLSEKLPPEGVVSMLNEYFQEMAEIIFRWDGTLDKFVGDEIMAIWGAPVEQPDHAELAVRCALNMSDRLEMLQEKWRSEGKLNIDCGIGINSGDVVVGNIGWLGKKMDYTAIGNDVNVAARVEKLTREYKTRILVTGNTYERIRPLLEQGTIGHLESKGFPPIRVRGKEEEITIFALKSLPSDQ